MMSLPALTVIVPVRDFDGMSRLSDVLNAEQRSLLTRALCGRSLTAAHGAGLDIVVVSSSPDVQDWANAAGVETMADPGGGLSAATHTAVERMEERPWMVLHADLPLVTAIEVARVAEAARTATVLVPSHDGGTNVIAATGGFPFAYGPGSFHRHLASVPMATVISAPELSIDIDTPAQLRMFPELLEVSSLSP